MTSSLSVSLSIHCDVANPLRVALIHPFGMEVGVPVFQVSTGRFGNYTFIGVLVIRRVEKVTSYVRFGISELPVWVFKSYLMLPNCLV